MQIKLLLFGVVKDVIGKSTLDFDMPKNTTIDKFKSILLQKYPDLSTYKSFSIAVNEAYVEDDYQLQEKDVVALIPPVSGG